MFDGHGLFLNGLMFALVTNDAAYLKADQQSAVLYQAVDCERFIYMKKSKPFYIYYYQTPTAF